MSARRLVEAGGAVALLWTLLALAACGPEPLTSCYLLDVSGSGRATQATYQSDLEAGVSSDATQGRNVRVLVVRGDPDTEGLVLKRSFAGLQEFEQQGTLHQRLSSLLADLDGQVLDTEAGTANGTSGSAIVAGMRVLARGGGCSGGLTAYTDGLERQAFSVYSAPITGPAGRKEIAERLARAGALPDLRDGVRVHMPYGGYVASGSKLAPERKLALHALWDALVGAAGGDLEFGR